MHFAAWHMKGITAWKRGRGAVRYELRQSVVCRISVPPRKQMDNNNPKPEVERILRTVLENLRELAHTPSKPYNFNAKF